MFSLRTPGMSCVGFPVAVHFLPCVSDAHVYICHSHSLPLQETVCFFLTPFGMQSLLKCLGLTLCPLCGLARQGSSPVNADPPHPSPGMGYVKS